MKIVLTIDTNIYWRHFLTVFLESHWTFHVPFKAVHYHTYRVLVKNTSDDAMKLIATHLCNKACLLHQTGRYIFKPS